MILEIINLLFSENFRNLYNNSSFPQIDFINFSRLITIFYNFIFLGILLIYCKMEMVGYILFFVGLHFIINIYHQFVPFKTGILLMIVFKIFSSILESFRS